MIEVSNGFLRCLLGLADTQKSDNGEDIAQRSISASQDERNHADTQATG